MSLVTHILLAEFHIDKGSIVTIQYPTPVPEDVGKLADLMLPDGAHLREDDSTFFLLNQSNMMENDGMELYTFQEEWTCIGKLNASFSDHSIDFFNENRLICSIPVSCITYQRPTVREIIFQSHHHVYGLRIWNAYQEEFLLDYLEEKCSGEKIPWAYYPALPASNGPPCLLYVMNLVKTKHISGVARGARVKSLAIVSPFHWIHVLKPILLLALDNYFMDPNAENIHQLFHQLNAIDLSQMPYYTRNERKILRNSADHSLFSHKFHIPDRSSLNNSTSNLKQMILDQHYYQVKVSFQGIPMPIKIPLVTYSSEPLHFLMSQLLTTFGNADIVGQSAKMNGFYQWHPHLDTGPHTHPIMLLMNAIWTGKRVLFLGHGLPSSQVGEHVLAACALTSGGILDGFLENCFPYISLTSLKVLESRSSFIAGVTNPLFEEQTSWWDLLCNINTRKMIISPKLKPSLIVNIQQEPMSLDNDNEAIRNAIKSMSEHASEIHIREQLYLIVKRFVEVCGALEVDRGSPHELSLYEKRDSALPMGPFFLSEQMKRAEFANVRYRLDGWKATTGFKLYEKKFKFCKQFKYFKHVDFERQVARLRSEEMDPKEAGLIYSIMNECLTSASPAHIIEFLTLFVNSNGGLEPLLVGLFQKKSKTRIAIIQILKIIEQHPVGNKLLGGLNAYFKVAMEQAAQDEHQTFTFESGKLDISSSLHSSQSTDKEDKGGLGQSFKRGKRALRQKIKKFLKSEKEEMEEESESQQSTDNDSNERLSGKIKKISIRKD